jgi:hypothetical protein
MGREEPGDSYSIINEWGVVWAVLSQERVLWAIPEPDVDTLHIHMSLKLFLYLACHKFLLRDYTSKNSLLGGC